MSPMFPEPVDTSSMPEVLVSFIKELNDQNALDLWSWIEYNRYGASQMMDLIAESHPNIVSQMTVSEEMMKKLIVIWIGFLIFVILAAALVDIALHARHLN